MSAKKRVPKLRFRGFSGEWEEKKIEDITISFSGGTPVSTNKEYYSGDIPFIGSGKINSENVDQYITIEALENSSAKIVEEGDLLYALYGATSGEVGISKIQGAINQAVLCLRTKENKYFLFRWLQNNKQNILATYLQGGQGNLSAQIIKNLKLQLPNKNEQTKIGNYFQNLNKLIEQKEKKYQKLGQLKKAILEKMFPKEGATTPEIRFKGFSGEWIIFNFDDVFKRIPSKKYQITSKEYQVYGKYPVIDQGKKRIIAYSDNTLKLFKNTSILVFGDHTRELKFIDFDFIVGADGTQLINTKEEFNNKFFYYQLLTKNIPNTGYNRHFKFLLEIIFKVPSLPEQTKIGNYFQKLDYLIELQDQELQKLKNIKKASLAKMFV